MASKRRNISYRNRKQETAEIGCKGGVLLYDDSTEGEEEEVIEAAGAVPFIGPSIARTRLMGSIPTLRNYYQRKSYKDNDNQFLDDGFKMAVDGKLFKRGGSLPWLDGDGVDMVLPGDGGELSWPQWQLPLLLSLAALAAGLAVSLVILIWLKNQMSSNEKGGGEGDGCESSGGEGGVQWIYHPVIRPATTPQCDQHSIQTAGGISPGDGKKDPIRSRAKGLLERRGSSASLTIDLVHPSQENITVTPTRECTTEEYLLSLGNVLNRQQLRSCLRDVRALHREFWDLPLNHPDKVNVPGSWAKNRYRTVIPNENTRVRLPSDPSSSDNPTGYINANYVKGYDGEEKAFIATQGPLTHTVVDFWAMIWSEKAPVIVMITKLWEKARSKCEPYFPTEVEANAIYGEFIVTVMAVHNKDGYIMRNLQIQKSEETRKVVHFWFDSWPDHKTPPNAHSLLSLAKEVEIARFQGVPQRRLSAAWLSSPPSLKDTTSPVLTLGTLELKQEEDELPQTEAKKQTPSPPAVIKVEAINVEMWKPQSETAESSPSKKRTRQSDHVRSPGQRFFKSPLPQDGSAFKFVGSVPSSPRQELYCDYPQSLKLKMVSKCRNMFYENKKQETTEISTGDSDMRSKSEDEPSTGWDAFTFDDPKDEEDLRKNADNVFWRFEKLSTNSTGSYDTAAQSPHSWRSLDKTSSGKLSVDSPNWTAETSPNLTGSSPRSGAGSSRGANWTQSSGDSSVWTASEDSPRCWDDLNSPQQAQPSAPPTSAAPKQQPPPLSPRWLDTGAEGGGAAAGPVVVHCSAGIGRTGCFIAICIGVNQLLGENCVDILGIVCKMRNDRGGMVQTAEQYEFIHRALALFEKSLPDQSGE